MPLLFACGACTDALVESRYWWLSLFPVLFLGLLADRLFFSAVMWLRRLDTRGSSATVIAVAFGLIVLSVFIGDGVVLGVATAAVVLLLAAGRSLVQNAQLRPVRIALIAASFIAGVWSTWPTHRDVETLVGICVTAAPFGRHEGWIVEELRTRPDAVATLEKEMGSYPESSLLELHAALGGDPQFRRTSCQRLAATNKLSPGLERVCRELQ